MKNLLLFKLNIVLGCVCILTQNQVIAQCTFSGLNLTYCTNDSINVLTGDPEGGNFSGPGIEGNTFNPAIAGPGVHTITYEIPVLGDGQKFMIQTGNPFSSPYNVETMHVAFGFGEWALTSISDAVVGTIFNSATSFVYLEGSDSSAQEFYEFYQTNQAVIENWVLAGGRLLINAAPNEGNEMELGFGGVILNYTISDYNLTHTWDITVLDPDFPALLGPNSPTNSVMAGEYYSHAIIEGGDCTPIAIETGNPLKVVLAEKCWGLGRVMFGGMTSVNFHSPYTEASNWRSNLYVYLNNNPCEASDIECTTSQTVEVFMAPTVLLTSTESEICSGESLVLTSTGADVYTFNEAEITNGLPYFPPSSGMSTFIVTGIDTISGCQNTDTVNVLVNAGPTITISASDSVVCIGSELILTGSGALSYVWDKGVIDGIAFIPENIDSTVYTVIGTDSIGCTNSARFTLDLIDCEAVGVPSAFSPNGDGHNDILLVKGLGFKAMHFVVYNRYGEVVFESWDQNYGWNGNFKSTPLNPAVYTWTLQYDLLNGASGLQKGNTTLIR